MSIDRSVGNADTRFEQLASIQQLLDQYRHTRDRALLYLAIELWDAMEADRKVRTIAREQRCH